MITRDGKTQAGWYICTEGINHFHIIELMPDQYLGSGQEYIIEGISEDDVISKVFRVSAFDDEGDIDVKLSTPLTKSEIISKAALPTIR